jgi:hypothetical protein
MYSGRLADSGSLLTFPKEFLEKLVVEVEVV